MARTRQPSGIAVVDPSYPYARNLRGAWISGQSGLLQNASKLGGLGDLTAVGAPTVIATPYGLGVQLNGSSQYLTNTSNAAITQFPFTFFLLVYMSTGQTGSSRIFDISQGTGISKVAGIRHEDGAGYRAQVYDGGNSQTNGSNKAKGTWNSFAGRFSSASERSLFVNGALFDTNSETRNALSGIDRITIGFAPWGAEYLNGIVVAPLAFDAALPDAEIAALASNPYRWVKQQRRLWIQLGAANDALDTAAGAVVTATASAIAGAATGSSAVNATATGATVVASASTIAGALTAASAATAATVAASASAIAGAATSSSQAAAATVTATASAISGAATGAGQSAAATVAATASATGGAATAASATTAATITASSSAIAGAASGTAAATATGATVVADASIIAGSATGNAAGTATGATVAADASAIAGSSSASAAATGQTAAVTASATAGSAQSDHAATGAVVSASTTAIPGAIAVGAGATTLGATVAATVTYQSGAVAAASSAAGWTQVVTAIAARGVAYGALPDIDPRYLVPSRKRRFTVQARGRRFNART